MLAILKLYGRLAVKATPRALRGWPVAVMLLVYPLLLAGASATLAPLGMLGGFMVAIVMTLLISSYLHTLAEVVAGRPIKVPDLAQSFTARFRDVMNVLFSFWIISLGLNLLTGGMGTQGATVRLLVGLVMAVFFNPIPEVIYQRAGAFGWFASLGQAARFVTVHWPAWLLPNILLAVALLAPTGLWQGPAGARVLGLQLVFSMEGPSALLGMVPMWWKPIMLLLVHWGMVFRGLLFQELSSGISARQRAIRDAWGRR